MSEPKNVVDYMNALNKNTTVRMGRLALVVIYVFLPVLARSQACGAGWCNTFPVGPVRKSPPISAFWNKLNYIPDVRRFFLYTSDGIYTFSNSWWSYGVLGKVATENPWIEETTSGTLQATVTDNSRGFLKTGIGPKDSAIELNPGQGSSFHADPEHGGVLIIDNEMIAYTADHHVKDSFVEVERGIRGTQASSHPAGTFVSAGAPVPQSRIHNALSPVDSHLPDRHPFLTSAYDSRRHELIQAGGITETNKLSDTWYLCFAANQFCSQEDIGMWKQLITRTPVPSRADSAMTYDSDDDVMILYGGQSIGNPNADTWLLCFGPDPQVSGNTVGCGTGAAYPEWVKVVTLGAPDPRFAHNIVYDSYGRVAVLFGGTNGTRVDPSDTWLYHPSSHTWTNAQPAGESPSAFRRPAMTYDCTHRRVVLYEGPPGKSMDGIVGGLYLYDSATNQWERRAIPGGPGPSGSVAHGRLSLDYDPSTDTFVATELAPPYGIAVWELKASVLDRH